MMSLIAIYLFIYLFVYLSVEIFLLSGIYILLTCTKPKWIEWLFWTWIDYFCIFLRLDLLARYLYIYLYNKLLHQIASTSKSGFCVCVCVHVCTCLYVCVHMKIAKFHGIYIYYICWYILIQIECKCQ